MANKNASEQIASIPDSLYDRLLFDEDFQALRKEALASIPEDKQKLLKKKDQQYLAHTAAPKGTKETIAAEYAKKIEQLNQNDTSGGWLNKLKTLLADFNLGHPFLSSGGFVTAGLMLGLFLPALLQTPQPNFRGAVGQQDAVYMPINEKAGLMLESISVEIVQSAKAGNADAQNKLGDLYLYGHGVNQDYIKAFEWYLKAAQQGHIIAQYNLSVIYSQGLGVEQNIEEAKRWLEKAQSTQSN